MSSRDLRPGDYVSFDIGPYRQHARVIEDRGNLGKGGRQIVGIEIITRLEPSEEPRRFEMPAEELTWEKPAA